MNKGLTEQVKPRERLEQVGETALSNKELLAIILRTGIKDVSVDRVAEKLLDYSNGLYALKNLSLSELQAIEGIGRIKAIELKACIELGRRINQSLKIQLGTIVSSQNAGEFLVSEMSHLTQEHVVVLFLNTKNHIIQKKVMFIGSASRSVAEPRDIFRQALKVGATKIIVAHNHPSGNPKPSHEDMMFTQRLVESGALIGVTVLDHIIVGDGQYVSFKEKNYI